MQFISDFSDNLWEPSETVYQPILDFESEILDEGKFADVNFLTAEIKRGFLDYVRQGIMLHTIRRYRLYKDKFKDFKTYCEQELGRQHFYCKQIIKAAAICLQLIKFGFQTLPNCIAQATALQKYAVVDKYGDCPLEEKWQQVVENVPKEKITAVTISDTIDENPEDRAKQIRIGGKAYQILQQKAAAAEMTVSKYLELLIGGTEPSDDEDCGEEEGEGKELTPEKEEILDDLEKSWLKTKPAAGFGNKKPSKKPSKNPQKAINPTIRSDKASDFKYLEMLIGGEPSDSKYLEMLIGGEPPDD